MREIREGYSGESRFICHKVQYLIFIKDKRTYEG